MDGHNTSTLQPVIVPAERLSPEALNGLIEEFVTRSGTDYGQREATLTEKCAAIQEQLASGQALIICDTLSQTCNIVPAEDLQQSGLCRPGKGAL